MAPDEIACSSATSIYEGVRLHRRLRKTAQDSERLSRLIGKDIVLKRANLNPERDYLEGRREVMKIAILSQSCEKLWRRIFVSTSK